MTDFNDRREDRTRDWRVGVVKDFMARKAENDALYSQRYGGQYIPTPKEVAKADKAQQRRRRRQGL